MKVSFEKSKRRNPTEDQGFRVNYAPAKRTAFRVRWYLLVAFVLSPVLLLMWFGFHRNILVIADGVITSEPITLYAPQNGFVSSVDSAIGDHVKRGDTLMQFTSPTIQKEVELLKEQLQSLETKQQQAILDTKRLYANQITIAKGGVIEQKALAQQSNEYANRGLVSLVDKVALEKYRVDAQITLNQARINQLKAIENLTQGAIETALLDVHKQLILAQVKQQLLGVYAPKKGKVNAVYVKPGQYINESTELLTLSNRETPVIIAYLEPDRFEYTHLGQTATVTLPNGDKYEAVISEPTTMVQRTPGLLSGPFDDSVASIKVTLKTVKPLTYYVEELPVEVRFHYLSDTDKPEQSTPLQTDANGPATIDADLSRSGSAPNVMHASENVPNPQLPTKPPH
ncbi:Uncharacterised protein [BD1-7 clade bacterium]|uniref:Uncharacterized protein n=1 Tax=BD1-7 clade bacterium TaxID=2029982 RepID=A0A5S9Q5V2_9GAMM|nr:Uncharacterised protein [BD1-7 clade bacterium]CAA0113132.1 Uncharacterised protein [BD1-7 clade bacterium]